MHKWLVISSLVGLGLLGLARAPQSVVAARLAKASPTPTASVTPLPTLTPTSPATSLSSPTPAPNATVSPLPNPGATAQPHGNTKCLMCHSDPQFMGYLPSGETVSLYIDPAHYYQSVHADEGLDCIACHANQKDYPHTTSQLTCEECHAQTGDTLETKYQPLGVNLNYPDARAIALELNEECRPCHEERFAEAVDSAHAQVLAAGNREAPVCVDCHGSHDITPPDQPRAKISQTCAKCHLAVYTTYRTSVHGAALETENNPDVPTCVACHGVHNIHGPRSTTFHDSTVAICGNCHSDPARMDKYGLSTAVLQTYLDDFHGRTVNFFLTANPQIASNKATCFDCHGIHNIRRAADPFSTVYPTNLQHTCQQCHAEASVTFPAAWLKHSAPSWEQTPALYLVNTGYAIMVPTFVGGFLGYIALDARRRFVAQRRARMAAVEGLDYAEDEDHTA